MVVNIISIKGNGRYVIDRMRKVNVVKCGGSMRTDCRMRTVECEQSNSEVECGWSMRMVNAEGGMRTVECGGCGRSKLDADSRIRRSYFWHELSSILLP